MKPARISVKDYLLSYQRLCAAVVCFTHQELCHAGAAYLVRDAHEGPLYCTWQNAMSRSVVLGAYQHRHTLDDYHNILKAIRRNQPASHPTPPRPMPAPPQSLIITTEGFLNASMACEFRLRYDDVRTTDAVGAIDVLLANGNSHRIDKNDPGFDQLVEYIEEHGYTISTR